MCNLQTFQHFFITQNYWPLNHDCTHWEFTAHMRPPQNAAEEAACEYARVHARDVVREDLKNMKMVQSNLQSGAKRYQVLGEMEPMVRHSYKVVAEQVGRGW
jgi:hypothetical protein